MSNEHHVDPFDVRVGEAAIGPLVWGSAKRDPDGQRHLLDLPLEPEALPAPASESQLAQVSLGIIGWVLSNYGLPELSRRVGQRVDLAAFFASAHWQEWLEKVQLDFEGGEPYLVRLNDEVMLPPPPNGHVTLIRERAQWSGQPVRILGDWLPTFDPAVQGESRRQVRAVADDILAGDEATSEKLVDSWFPLERELNVDPIYRDLPKEIHALLSRNRTLDPLDVLFSGFRQARDTLKAEYDWERVDGATLYGPGLEALRFDDAKAEVEWLCREAGLTERHRRIIGLEFALAARDERWSNEHKARYLGLRPGNYKEGLSKARAKLQAPQAEGYSRLLRAIFGEGLTRG